MAQQGGICTKCDIQYCTYPEHELFQTSESLLGSKDAMCEGLFHVFPAPEFNILLHGSLSGEEHDSCRPYAMTLVAFCGSLVARFTNCNRKHAEEFLVTNKKLYYYIRTHRPKTLVLFMKHHPCHHSSGNHRRYPEGYLFQGQADVRSCALKIIRYVNEVLRPNGVTLHIHVSWLYKAFWQQAVREDDKCTVRNSLEGLTLMQKAGIQFHAMKPHHWIMLANMCNEPIPLQQLLQSSRLTADKGVNDFLKKRESEVSKEKEDDVVAHHHVEKKPRKNNAP